jgi:hypothetical protein
MEQPLLAKRTLELASLVAHIIAPGFLVAFPIISLWLSSHMSG